MAIDSLTIGVLTTLAIDVLMAFLILLGFICIRKYRGDKQIISTQGDRPTEVNDLLFDESIDSQKIDLQLEKETDL